MNVLQFFFTFIAANTALLLFELPIIWVLLILGRFLDETPLSFLRVLILPIVLFIPLFGLYLSWQTSGRVTYENEKFWSALKHSFRETINYLSFIPIVGHFLKPPSDGD